jgi:hypothetical protein
MLSKGEYFSIKIKTGLYEKISLEQYTNYNDKVLFEHYIPLEQNEYNTLQINITDGHILVMLNNKIIFHLLLKNQSFSGGINYASHFVDFEHPVKTKYIPIPETLKNSMYTVLKKIPPIIIE